jgi:hypothetical protein
MLDQSEELIDIGERIGEAAEAGDIAEVQKLVQEGEPINDSTDSRSAGRKESRPTCAQST